MTTIALVPPSNLRCQLSNTIWRHALVRALPPVAAPLNNCPALTRRGFLQTAAIVLGSGFFPTTAKAAGPVIFNAPSTSALLSSTATLEQPHVALAAVPLRLGQIPDNFWSQPRELWLRRQGTTEEIREVYWRDGNIVPEGYWKICALLRDAKANVMTTMDPGILDVLWGITGYYRAWRWMQPIVATSGFRTLATNSSLMHEGAARNSMHLYGKAIDVFIKGVPPKDIGILGLHLRQGGVGFYPSKGFTHLDTGRMRTWRG
jgi:uncharacterized protein YcbK (DUF882 family)